MGEGDREIKRKNTVILRTNFIIKPERNIQE